MYLGVDYLAQLQAEMLRAILTRSRREKDAFAALDVNEQAWRFMNWQSRLVHPHPREVNKSDGFDSQPAVQANRPYIEALLTSIARGDDVGAYLSDDVRNGYCIHLSNQKDGPDFDLLLNEWGIHHLHIDQTPGKSGRKVRSNDLLYVIFGRGVAFVLAVAPHRAWTSRRLIETTVRSWPNQGLFVSLNMLPGRGWTEDEHKVLRRTGLTTVAVVDDKPWVSGVTCGMTTALVSTRVVRETGELLRFLHFARKNSQDLERQLRKNAVLTGVAWPTEPAISIRWLCGPTRYSFGFVEKASGATVVIETSLARSGD